VGGFKRIPNIGLNSRFGNLNPGNNASAVPGTDFVFESLLTASYTICVTILLLGRLATGNDISFLW